MTYQSRQRTWTIYGCKHLTRGDFGPREWSLAPPVMSCSDCEEIEVVSAKALLAALPDGVTRGQVRQAILALEVEAA